jgi:M6 family metalloprotease-like protein
VSACAAQGPDDPSPEASGRDLALASDALSVSVPSSVGDVVTVSPADGSSVESEPGLWVPIPGLSGAIVTEAGDDLAITLSAEMLGSDGASVRARVDGDTVASSTLFKAAGEGRDDVRAYTFVAPGLAAGQHVVELEWFSAAGRTALMRDRTMTLHTGASNRGEGRLATAVSASTTTVSSSANVNLAGMVTTIETAKTGPLAITFSADASVDEGRLIVQALVDGVVVSDALFLDANDASTHRGARRYTFVSGNIAPGAHEVRLRARVDGAPAQISARTLTVTAGPANAGDGGMVVVGNQLAPTEISGTTFVDVPTLRASFVTSSDASTVIIDAGAEAAAPAGRLRLRALVDGQPAKPGTLTFLQREPRYRANSFAFLLDNLKAGTHEVRIQAAVDPDTVAYVGDRFLRVQHARRSGSAFVKPYSDMRPKHRTFQTVVICFDPLRPDHERPTKAQLVATFEGPRPSVKTWFDENSGGRVGLGRVTYLGCEDGNWYLAPPAKRGNWYWDNEKFSEMWQDALRAADPAFDFHAYDRNNDDHLTPDELMVAIVRPQDGPYGTNRTTSVVLDGDATPLRVRVQDLYLSSLSGKQLEGVGLTSHEFSHAMLGAQDLYDQCPERFTPRKYSLMSSHGSATHLDPLHKMKSGFVTPDAIAIPSWSTRTLRIGPVETSREVTVLYDPERGDDEYFVVEYRYGGDVYFSQNYDFGFNEVVVWHMIEDRATAVAYPPADPSCEGGRPPVRLLGALDRVDESMTLAWADGTPARIRVTLKNAPFAAADVEIAKTP